MLDAPNVADTALFATALRAGPGRRGARRACRTRGSSSPARSPPPSSTSSCSPKLARDRPDWSLALVGPVGLGDPRPTSSELTALPNVHLLGPRAYAELPAVLRGADVALIPYALNELTASIFPMKVYEYLAAGLPVVSTPLPALDGVDEITFAADGATVAAALDRLIAEDSPQARTQRSQRAQRNSWTAAHRRDRRRALGLRATIPSRRCLTTGEVRAASPPER